ncbi:MAG: DUF6444 domain-containing protein [Isosphaeraceae bacterium]
MIDPLPIPDELWTKVPREAQAAITAAFLAMRQRVEQLETRVHDLEARLKLNSTNSSKPPSSDPIGLKRKPPAPPSGRKRGGQPGHRKARRTLVPPEQVHQTFDCKPTACRRCGRGLEGEDPEPRIHQVAELPSIEPVVDEYRLHRLTCSGCGATTCGALPEGVPTGCFGPYLQAVLAMFAGAYRLSKRQIQQLAADLFALSIATGMIQAGARSAAVLEAPTTSWRSPSITPRRRTSTRRRASGPARSGCGRWSPHSSRSSPSPRAAAATSLGALLGSEDDQVVGSDRFSRLRLIPRDGQVCQRTSAGISRR